MDETNAIPLLCCRTRYPVMLVHGTAVSDRRRCRCWGRIPKTLTAHGAAVCFGRQDGWGSTPNNALQLAKSVDSALELYKADKINIIAHSKGGLDARALTALPGYAEKIASITTISTPHHGMGWMSKIWPLARFFIAPATVLIYPFLRIICGDKKPNPYKLSYIMTRRGSEKFNLETPDCPEIYYQSYAGKTPTGSRNKLFMLVRMAANRFDGENDGMISVEAAKWGEFRGIITGGGKRGLSHADEVDYFKRDYAGDDSLRHDVQSYTDVPQIYVHIVHDLKEMGF